MNSRATVRIVGAIRIRNEERWIERSLRSFVPICEQIYVFDDRSTDTTVEICRQFRNVELFESPFRDLNEARDKQYLLDRIDGAAWVCMWDGDEVLQPGKAEALRLAMQTSKARALAFPVLYLWDREDQVRCDGVYGTMSRVSAFRPGPERFEATGGVNFHCGNAPQGIRGRELVNAPLLHYGYLDKADRIRKHAWYNEKDPNNQTEDCYRHIVQGDVPEVPAESKLKHAGPLRFRSL